MAIAITTRGQFDITTGDPYDVTVWPAFTPSPVELLCLLFACTVSNADPATPAVTGHDGTTAWTLIDILYWDTLATARAKIFLFACVTGSNPASAVVTIDNVAQLTSGGAGHLFEISGADESNGLVQTFRQVVKTTPDPANSSSGAVTLAGAGHSSNRAFSCWHRAENDFAIPRSGWTEIYDGQHSTPNHSFQSQWRPEIYDADASATWVDSVKYGGMAFEVKALTVVSPPPGGFCPSGPVLGGGLLRGSLVNGGRLL